MERPQLHQTDPGNLGQARSFTFKGAEERTATPAGSGPCGRPGQGRPREEERPSSLEKCRRRQAAWPPPMPWQQVPANGRRPEPGPRALPLPASACSALSLAGAMATCCRNTQLKECEPHRLLPLSHPGLSSPVIREDKSDQNICLHFPAKRVVTQGGGGARGNRRSASSDVASAAFPRCCPSGPRR